MSGKRRRNSFADGILAAQVAMAEIIGPMKINGIHEQTWNLICKLNVRFCELALDALKDDASIK